MSILQKLLNYRLLFCRNTKNHQTFSMKLLEDRIQYGNLGPAGHAPGGPEADDHELSFQRFQGVFLPIQRRGLKRHGRFFQRGLIGKILRDPLVSHVSKDDRKKGYGNGITFHEFKKATHIYSSFPVWNPLLQEEKARPLARENPGIQIKGHQQKEPHRLFRVRIIDNDYNTYEQVIRICMKALSIGFEDALQIALAVDHNGQADVFQGDEGSARQVAEVIASIGIEVRVEPLTDAN